MGEFLQALFGTAAGAGLFKSAYDKLGDVGDAARTGAVDIGDKAAAASQFIPFGVTTSGMGNVGTSADGSTNINLSPEQQALQNLYQQQATAGTSAFDLNSLLNNQSMAFGKAADMFGSFGENTGLREQDVYDRIRATQIPEEERQRNALQEQLLGQGRLGITTGQYGGTPEQLALAKAQEEAQNTASLMALQQAQAEDQQAYGQTIGLSNLGAQNLQAGGMLATQALQNQYAPQAALLSALSPSLNVASLADIGRRQAAEIQGTAGISGLEAYLGANLGRANMLGNLGAGMFSGSFNPVVSDGQVFGGLFNSIESLLKPAAVTPP